MSESDIYGLIVARKEASEVLMKASEGRLYLPIAAIAKHTRPAQQITAQLKERWGLIGVCLGNDGLHDATKQGQYQIIEPLDPNWAPADGLCWVPRTNLNTSTSDGEELEVTERALQPRASKGPFAATGWLDDLVRWMEPHLRSAGHSLTGKFEQLNASEFFNLIRFETNRGAVWFKAVGEPNLREFPITLTLARNFPGYVPTIIATQPSWNAWLTVEVAGSMLDEKSDIATWEKAARSVASLQIESARRTPELLDAGCRDIRIPILLDQIDPFFEVMAELMGKQPKVPPPVLNRQELHALAAQTKEAYSCLGELELPDTLGHLDFNPGNIMVSPNGCVFVDWAEAYVGHPFFTFEYLREHLARMHPGEAGWRARVRSRYLEPWKCLVSSKKLSRALEITPLLAVFAYAAGADAWPDEHRLENPQLAGYLRALTRRMQHEARRVTIGGSDA